MVEATCNAFEKYYWKSRQVPYSGMPGAYLQEVSKEDVGSPLTDLVNYVVSAWKAKIERNDACYYGGTKLLFSVLEKTNRRWTSSVREANELFNIGRKISGYIWSLLEKYGDGQSFRKEIGHLTRELQKRFKRVSR
jgi:hypothetical protein